ncbi:MAG: NUDIX domain-containing protein [Patescibacteria group bacterium]
MEIKSQISNLDGSMTQIIYNDADSFDFLDKSKVKQVYGVCFFEGKMLIVFNGKRKAWGLVGGSIEAGESFEECLKREVKEESNMQVLSSVPVGYQAVTIGDNTIYQLRYACAVRPIDSFVADPDNAITEIKLIDPLSYKEFFDWGEIGNRIIKRGTELKYKLFK